MIGLKNGKLKSAKTWAPLRPKICSLQSTGKLPPHGGPTHGPGLHLNPGDPLCIESGPPKGPQVPKSQKKALRISVAPLSKHTENMGEHRGVLVLPKYG